LTSDDSTHYITPQEAGKLLPDIKTKLREIMDRKRLADSLKSEVEHYHLLGFEVPESNEKVGELDQVIKQLMQNIAELEDLGILIRDIDSGLVDFPAEKFGDRVFLCWKYGESEIDYWHGIHEGVGGRKSLKSQVISP
jgi:hypothetical protein